MRNISIHKYRPARFKRLALTLFILSAFPLQPAFATAYKWVDEDGNTHYTQTPPPGGLPSEALGPPPKVDTEAAQRKMKSQSERADKLQADRAEKAEKMQKQLARKAEQETLCRQARASQASFERPRVNEVREDGSRRVMGEEERQAKLKQAKTQVSKFCGAD